MPQWKQEKVQTPLWKKKKKVQWLVKEKKEKKEKPTKKKSSKKSSQKCRIIHVSGVSLHSKKKTTNPLLVLENTHAHTSESKESVTPQKVCGSNRNH